MADYESMFSALFGRVYFTSVWYTDGRMIWEFVKLFLTGTTHSKDSEVLDANITALIMVGVLEREEFLPLMNLTCCLLGMYGSNFGRNYCRCF